MDTVFGNAFYSLHDKQDVYLLSHPGLAIMMIVIETIVVTLARRKPLAAARSRRSSGLA